MTLITVCVPQLQTLIQETDPGADYRIDRALNEACESVIQTACKHIRNGDPMWVCLRWQGHPRSSESRTHPLRNNKWNKWVLLLMLGTFGMFVFLQQGLFCCLRHWRAHCFKSEPTSFTINFPVCSSIFTFNLVSVCLFIFKCAEIETLKVKCVVQPEQRYFVKTVCVCVCVGSCPVWWSISTLIRWLKTVNTDCWSCSTSSPETGSESQNWKESGFFFLLNSTILIKQNPVTKT